MHIEIQATEERGRVIVFEFFEHVPVYSSPN